MHRWMRTSLIFSFLSGLNFLGPKLWLSKDLRRSVKSRHPWLFDKAIRGEPSIAAGSLVSIYWKKQFLACGFYDPSSPLRVRLLWWPGDLDRPDTATWAPSLAKRAAQARRTVRASGLRLLHGEADWMPGLVLDVYGTVGVCGFDGLGAEAFWRPKLPSILEAVAEAYPLQGVVRKDGRETLWGHVPTGRSSFQEHGITYEVDVWKGHKTGFFLDQRPNRARLRELAEAKDVLDLFSYTGGFAVAAALGGARSTCAVDIAPRAMEACQRNFQLNGLEAEICSLEASLEGRVKHGLHVADCWEFLREAESKGLRVDLAVVDPPSMAPKASARPSALKAYESLNSRALKLLRPGGRLISCSCSSHITRADLLQVVQTAAERSGRQVSLEEEGGAGEDHPLRTNFPEGDYLQVLHMTVE